MRKPLRLISAQFVEALLKWMHDAAENAAPTGFERATQVYVDRSTVALPHSL